MTGRTNKTGNNDNSENENNNSGCLRSIVITILIIAGILLALALLTDPVSAGIWIPLIIFFTIFALIVVTLTAILLKSRNYAEHNNGYIVNDSQSMSKTSKDDKFNNQTISETKEFSLPRVAIISGIIGIIVVFIFLHRENTGANVNWKYLPKPDDSPIDEILSDQLFVVVKTQSGNRFIARPSVCHEYCWDDDFSGWAFKEEEAVNDPLCPDKSSPKPPPEEQIRDEFIFRLCKSDGSIREMRIVIADNGDLWVWQKWIDSTYGVISRTISNSIFVAPVFALLGVLLYKMFRSLINQGKN